MDFSDTQSPMDHTRLQDDNSSTQENTVDSTVDTEQKGENKFDSPSEYIG